MSAHEYTRFTVLLKSPAQLSPKEIAAVQHAILSIENCASEPLVELTSLALNKKEFLLSTVVSFPVAIMANFATDAIKEALEKNTDTKEIIIEDVIPEPDPGPMTSHVPNEVIEPKKCR